MLALTDQQLDVVRTAAHPLPRSLRSAFLQRLAAQLDGGDFGDGQLHRVAHGIVCELLSEPRDRQRARPRRQEREPTDIRGFGTGVSGGQASRA